MTCERGDIDFRWLLFERRKKRSQRIRGLTVLPHNDSSNALSDLSQRLSLRQDQRICMAMGVDKPGCQYMARRINHRVCIEGHKIAFCDNMRTTHPHAALL